MEPSIYKPSIYKGAGIYKAGAEGGGGGGIPGNYEKFDYLYMDAYRVEGYGAIIIDLPQYIGNDFLILTKFKTGDANTSLALFDLIRENDNSILEYDLYYASAKYYNLRRNQGSSIQLMPAGQAQNKIFTLCVFNGGQSVCSPQNKQTDSSARMTFEGIKSIKIFSAAGMGGWKMKFYGMRVFNFETNELIHDFIPVKNLSNSVCGVFDIVDNIFYPANDGNISFIKAGND